MISPLLAGIAILMLCALGYFFSWKYLKQENYRLAILLLVICGFALRLYTSSDGYIHEWDERYHALVAKNLIKHPLKPTLYDDPLLTYDYRNWTANHIWVHKQPLPLWMMSASMWIFGVHEITLRLPSILLSTIGIWLSFLIGSYFFNRKAGYLTAFFFSINGLIIELTAGRVATDHIDVFFLFFIMLAIVFGILFVQKENTIFNVLAGLSIGAAILSKWLPALIVVPIWLLIVVDSGKFKPKTIFFQFIIMGLTCIATFVPWQIYIFSAYPVEAQWEAGFNLKHFTQVLEGRTGPLYYFIDKIRVNYGELIYLPLGWFLWRTVKSSRNLKRMAIVIWFIVPLVFFSMAKTKMQGYLLFTSPALFIMTSEFFLFIADQDKNQKLKWFFNVLMLIMIALPIRYMIERIKPFGTHEQNPAWAKELKTLGKQNISKGVLFNYSRPVEAMFYTDMIAYPQVPEKQIILDLMDKGYTVVLNDNEKLASDLKSIKGIVITKLVDDSSH